MSMKCVSVKSDDGNDAQRVIEIDVPLDEEKNSYQTRRVPQKNYWARSDSAQREKVMMRTFLVLPECVPAD